MNIKMLLDNCFNPDIRVYKEAKYLVGEGNNVEILAMDRKNKFIDKPFEKVDGIDVKRFFPRTQKANNIIKRNNIVAKVLKPIIYFWWLIRYFLQVKKYLKNSNTEVIHCHDFIMAYFATIFLNKYTLVFDMHEYYFNKKNKFINYVIKKCVHKAQNKAKWIIYVNDFQKNMVKEKNIPKMIEIPNYPSENIFNNIEKSTTDKLRVSYVGVVRDFQSLKRLVESDLNPDEFQIRIHGDGPAYTMLKEIAEKNGKAEILCGSYDGVREIEQIYQNTDVLYCVYLNSNPNWANAMPVKAFEGILTLTPIISSENCVLGDFIQKYDVGFTIKNQDKEEIETLLKKIKNEPEILKQKVENMKKIQNDFLWEKCVKKLDLIYKGNGQ